jgi:hypothetical protein
MAGNSLLESRKFDHDMALKVAGAFEMLNLSAPGEDLATELLEDVRNEVRISLVFDGVVDHRPCQPVCSHKNSFLMRTVDPNRSCGYFEIIYISN